MPVSRIFLNYFEIGGQLRRETEELSGLKLLRLREVLENVQVSLCAFIRAETESLIRSNYIKTENGAFKAPPPSKI